MQNIRKNGPKIFPMLPCAQSDAGNSPHVRLQRRTNRSGINNILSQIKAGIYARYHQINFLRDELQEEPHTVTSSTSVRVDVLPFGTHEEIFLQNLVFSSGVRIATALPIGNTGIYSTKLFEDGQERK